MAASATAETPINGVTFFMELSSFLLTRLCHEWGADLKSVKKFGDRRMAERGLKPATTLGFACLQDVVAGFSPRSAIRLSPNFFTQEARRRRREWRSF